MKTLLGQELPYAGTVYGIAKHTSQGLVVEAIAQPKNVKELIDACKWMSRNNYEHVPVAITTMITPVTSSETLKE